MLHNHQVEATLMRRSRFPFHAALLCATLCTLTLFVPQTKAAEDKSPAIVQYEALSKDFVKLRDVDAKRLGPQQLLEAAESLEGKVQKLVDSAAGDPSAKSKAQALLSRVYEFDGKAPESKAAYSAYLDTLEAWQGKDYAVMVVRRAGDRMLEMDQNAAKALQYYDLLLEKYPNHASTAHALYQSGLACIESKAYGEAVKRFDATVGIDPSGYYAPWALRKKAYALAEMVSAEGDFTASMAVLDELAAKYPTPHWKAYAGFRKGYTLARQEKYLEAIACYNRGIADDPSSPYSEMGKQHIEQVRKIMEQQVLDQMAQQKTQPDALPGTASAKTAGPVSMVFPAADDHLGEGQP